MAEIFGTDIFKTIFQSEKARTITTYIYFNTSPAGKVSSGLFVPYTRHNIVPYCFKPDPGGVVSHIKGHHTGKKAAERIYMKGGEAGTATIEVGTKRAVFKSLEKLFPVSAPSQDQTFPFLWPPQEGREG